MNMFSMAIMAAICCPKLMFTTCDHPEEEEEEENKFSRSSPAPEMRRSCAYTRQWDAMFERSAEKCGDAGTITGPKAGAVSVSSSAGSAS